MSVLFDADNEYLSLASPPDYNAAYTVCGWIKAAYVYTGFLWSIEVGGGVNNRDTAVILDAGGGLSKLRLTMNIGGVGSNSDSATLTSGQWYHMAIVRSSTTAATPYFDGVAGTTLTGDVTGRTAANYLYVGNASQSSFIYELTTSFTHMKIWTAALSAAEITNEMRSIRPVHQLSSLWAWYPMIAGT